MAVVILCCMMLLSLVAGIIGGYYAYKRAQSEARDAVERVTGWLTDVDQDGISPFGHLVNEIAEILAQRLGVTVQAAIRGSLGGQATSLANSLEEHAVSEHPELALTELLPKSLRRKPLAQAALQMIIQRVLSGSSGTKGSGGSTGGGNGQAKFNL